ncbi:TPA: flagellar transcriptional regulator FlhD [Burkholderia vietnamiensis]|nr:flagellar transcriptional regulator FlhD [Burkholderia vietnamiensis]HDR8975369.1 flagellar transcriptional regulator FlhD [Burkholderia vietnamiensis]HDR9065752.1 flagellar transcriptional regulator FlhD [Burkholderia vietnamiensis]
MIVDDENLHENPRCRREEKLPVERGPRLRARPGWLVVVAFRRAILQAIVRVQRACFGDVDRYGDIVFTLPHESPRLTRAGNQSPAIVAAWWRPGAGQIRCADNQTESRQWPDRRMGGPPDCADSNCNLARMPSIRDSGGAVWEANVSYLWLSLQRLLADCATATFRLGVTGDPADANASLSMTLRIERSELASFDRSACRA